MENDPNQKDSKGKRIFRKIIRRSSKTSNNSQKSSLELGAGASQSKSFENKRSSVEINDSTPLPTPDGSSERVDSLPAPKLKIGEKASAKMHRSHQERLSELKLKKTVGIKEEFNEILEEETASTSKATTAAEFLKPEQPLKADNSKRALKRVGFYQYLLFHFNYKIRGDSESSFLSCL